MKRLIKQAQSYTVQFMDDEAIVPEEQNQGAIAFIIRVTGEPCNPDMMIQDIMPKVQRYIKTTYPYDNFDNITYENFNVETAVKSDRFPNTIDFSFSLNIV